MFVRDKPLSWLAVTGVSHHWRNVALGNPSLWSRIYNTYPKLLVWECLRRSKSVSLSVELESYVSRDTQIVTSSISRIRELDLTLDPVSWISLSENLHSPAPLLESLFITMPTPSIPIPMISENTFGGPTPRLRHLKLAGCSFDLRSSMFTNLVTLHLHRPHHTFSAEDLLTTLHNCPRLTSLKLFDVLDDSANLIPSHQAVVQLPALESFSMKGATMKRAADVLSHLFFPMNTTLQLFTEEKSYLVAEELQTEFASLVNIYKFAGQLPSTDSRSFIPRHQFYLGNGEMLLLNVMIENIQDLRHPIVVFNLIARVFDCGPLRSKAEAISTFAALPVSPITKFGTHLDIGIDVWRDVIGRLPELRSVWVHRDFAVNFLHAIGNDYDAHKSNLGGWDPIFPALEAMYIWHITFAPLGSVDRRDIVFSTPSDSFIEAIRARKTVGKGLKWVEFRECVRVECVSEALREVVDCVMWDGWPRHSDSDSDSDSDSEDDDSTGESSAEE